MALLDTLTSTTANAAYSMARLLRTAYSGAAFQVRRASDNTTQDIGFVSGLSDVASLLAFCAGTNGFVTTLYDQSGNAADMVQATTSLQPQVVSAGALLTPIAGYPSANNGQMTCSSFVFPGTYTLSALSAVVNAGTPTSGRVWTFIATGEAHDSDTNDSMLVRAADSSGTIDAYRAGSPRSAVAGPLNAPIVVGSRWDGIVSTTSVNAISGADGFSSAAFGTTGRLNLMWDGRTDGSAPGGEPWVGATSEFIIAGVMSPGDYTAAQASMFALYAGLPYVAPAANQHRYWRFYFPTTSPNPLFSDLELHSVMGGAAIPVAAGILDSLSGGNPPRIVYNGAGPAQLGSTTGPHWVAYDLGYNNYADVVEFVVTGSSGNPFSEVDLQWSDDYQNWTTVAAFPGLAPSSSRQVFAVPVPDITATPASGAITFAGFAPTPVADIVAAPGTGAITFTGYVPSLGIGISPAAGSLVFTGYAPVPVAHSAQPPMFSIIV